MVDLLGGHSHFQMSALTMLLPSIQSGKLRALAVCTADRNSQLPDVPTVSETIPGFVAQDWWGIVAPAGTPTPVVDRLSKEIKTVLQTDEVKANLQKLGATPGYLNPAEFDRLIKSEINTWAQVIKRANIKLK